MRGDIVTNWSQVDMDNPKHRKQVFGALQHFLDNRRSAALQVAAQVQHLGTTADFPQSVIAVIEKYRLQADFDDGWRAVFKFLDFTGSNRNGYKIGTIEDGLSFKLTPTGHSADVYKMSGEEETVTFQMYSGGLGWHRTLFDDKEYWQVEDNAFAFANKSGAFIANTHYALIDTIGVAQNLAWQAPIPPALAAGDPNYIAIRDFETINQACENIILDLANLGMGVGNGTTFVILAPIQLKSRLLRAQGLLNLGLAGASERGLVYNTQLVFTTGLASATSYYVCVPGIKSHSATRMNLTVFDQFDPLTYSDIAVGWFRFGAVIGDVRQFQRCATA